MHAPTRVTAPGPGTWPAAPVQNYTVHEPPVMSPSAWYGRTMRPERSTLALARMIEPCLRRNNEPGPCALTADLPIPEERVPMLRSLTLASLASRVPDLAAIGWDGQIVQDMHLAAILREVASAYWIEERVCDPCEVIAILPLANERVLVSLADPSILRASASDRTLTRGIFARVWCMQTGRLLYDLVGGHHSSAFALCALRCGLIATGSSDREIQVWRDHDGAKVRELKGHSDAVLHLTTFDQLDQRHNVQHCLVSWSRDNSARLWDPSTGACLAVVTGNNEYVSSMLQVSRACVVSWRDTTCCMWNMSESRVHTVPTLTRSSGGHIAVFPEFDLIAVAGVTARDEAVVAAARAAAIVPGRPDMAGSSSSAGAPVLGGSATSPRTPCSSSTTLFIPTPTIALYRVSHLLAGHGVPVSHLDTSDRVVMRIERVPGAPLLLALCQHGVVMAYDVLHRSLMWSQPVENGTMCMRALPTSAGRAGFLTTHNHGSQDQPGWYDVKHWLPVHRARRAIAPLSNTPLSLAMPALRMPPSMLAGISTDATPVQARVHPSYPQQLVAGSLAIQPASQAAVEPDDEESSLDMLPLPLPDTMVDVGEDESTTVSSSYLSDILSQHATTGMMHQHHHPPM